MTNIILSCIIHKFNKKHKLKPLQIPNPKKITHTHTKIGENLNKSNRKFVPRFTVHDDKNKNE